MKTKTITLAGTAVAAIFATGFVLSAQAATNPQDNTNAKQITRQLNEGQMQHPGVVNGRRAGSANMRLSQNDTGMTNTGTSSEDVNTNGTDQTDQNQYNQNTGYTPGANDQGMDQDNTGVNGGDTGDMNEDQSNPQNMQYTPSPKINDEGVNDNGVNTGYTPGATDEHTRNLDQDEDNPEDTTGVNQNNPGVENRGESLIHMRGAVSLSDVPNAGTELQNIPIETRNGERVGTVQSIDVDNNGTARTIQADVEGRQVSLDPNNVVYIKDQNALVTDLTRPEIENLPPVSKTY